MNILDEKMTALLKNVLFAQPMTYYGVDIGDGGKLYLLL